MDTPTSPLTLGRCGSLRKHRVGPREATPATWVSPSHGPRPYLRHEGDLERAGHLLLEGSHLLQEGPLPEPGLGQPGVPGRVVVEGEGEDQGLRLRVVVPWEETCSATSSSPSPPPSHRSHCPTLHPLPALPAAPNRASERRREKMEEVEGGGLPPTQLPAVTTPHASPPHLPRCPAYLCSPPRREKGRRGPRSQPCSSGPGSCRP